MAAGPVCPIRLVADYKLRTASSLHDQIDKPALAGTIRLTRANLALATISHSYYWPHFGCVPCCSRSLRPLDTSRHATSPARNHRRVNSSLAPPSTTPSTPPAWQHG